MTTVIPVKHDKFVDILRNTGIMRSYKRKNITTYHISIDKSEGLWQRMERLQAKVQEDWVQAEDFVYQVEKHAGEVVIRTKSLDPARLY
jgi:hypothetical protein